MSAGRDAFPVPRHIAIAREEGGERARHPTRSDELAKEGLQSAKQLDEYAALLGLRYDEQLNKFSVR